MTLRHYRHEHNVHCAEGDKLGAAMAPSLCLYEIASVFHQSTEVANLKPKIEQSKQVLPKLLILDFLFLYDSYRTAPTGTTPSQFDREAGDLEAKRLGQSVQVSQLLDMAILLLDSDAVTSP